jgi:glycosyltransferase involved in cell wall biosynthesis
MKKYCAENGLSGHVIFTGKILNEDEKAVIIKNSKLLVFPSTYDTDGIIKIECACYSVPTICFENTGVSSGFVNDETAFIVENNKDKFVEKLRFILDNPDIAKQIGDNVRRETYITWKDVGKKLKVVYDRLLNTKNLKNAKKNKNKTTKKTKV